MSITIRDIARLADVNFSTVSRALRHDPLVKMETADKIHAIARELGYVPNLSARNLQKGRTQMISLLTGDLSSAVESEITVCLNERLAEQGYILNVLSYAPDPLRLMEDRLEKLEQRISDGALILAPEDQELSPGAMAVLKRLRCPRLYIDRWLDECPFPAVSTDNSVALSRLCEFAQGAGMDGALLAYRAHNTVSRDREECAIRELTRRKIPFLLVKFDALEGVTEFLQRHRLRRPSVFCNGATGFPELVPLLPAGFLTLAFDWGVPVDRTKFGDIFLAIQNFKKLANAAVSEILAQINQKEPGEELLRVPPERYERIPGS